MTSFGKRNSKQIVVQRPRTRPFLRGVSSCQMLVMEVKLT
jgi:hypothetical protein